jgi:hypothetical protein
MLNFEWSPRGSIGLEPPSYKHRGSRVDLATACDAIPRN